MKPFFFHRAKRSPSAGFTLIVTVSLLVLLTIIALGMLTLSSSTLRSSSRITDAGQARANARMALLIALGELQKHTGPDTRVTANAAILDPADPSPPPVLGVWKSWEGSNHEANGPMAGRPISPGNDYKAAKRTRFLSWLISGTTAAVTNPTAAPSVARGPNTVPLLSTGSVGDDPQREHRQIHLTPSPLSVTQSPGSIAWWIGGENQKARLPKPYQPAQNTVAAWSTHQKSHSVADPQPFRLDAVIDDPTLAERAVSLRQADLISARTGNLPISSEFFHDLSAMSTGLLTNTATGGWRKDLSLATENWNTLPSSNLPFFQISANRTSKVSRPTSGNSQAPQSIFYPWSAYWSGPSDAPIYQHGSVSTWHSLKDFATAYQRVASSAGGYTTPFSSPNLVNPGDSFAYLHQMRTAMVIARMHWVFSHRTIRQPNPANPNDPLYRLEFLITPVITMWNPYNVSLTSPANLRILLAKPLPCAFRHYDRIGNPLPNYRRITLGYTFGNTPEIPGNHPVLPPNANSLSYLIADAFTLAPGETRVFSPTSIAGLGDANLQVQPGLRMGTGHSADLSSYLGPLNAKSRVKVDITFDARFKEDPNKPDFVGVWLDMFLGAGGGHYLQVHRMQYLPTVANAYWPPIPATELASPAADEIEGVWQPFFSAVYGSRISGPSSTGLPGKGLLQTSPMVSYARVEEGYTTAKGGAHPANAANELSFFKHTGNDDKLPNANQTNNRGFIVTGFAAADGLSRMVLGDVPLSPLLSLAELQHWDLRSQNGVPPFQLHVIANSDASPLIPPHAVVNDGAATNLQHDDSYCANHLLFDDWIFSSIAPHSTILGRPSGSASLKKTFIDFVNGSSPLPNRAYQPLQADRTAARTSEGAENLYDQFVNRSDSWQTIASRIEVEGMFNVNSTSVSAWRALLGHARNQQIPHHSESGMRLSSVTHHGLSRFNIAGDTQAGELGMSGGFSLSSEITGYRVFSEPLLDSLAKEIVEQVRLRGPFLSLAEFVNRQLSNNKTLAIAGAIQTALNEMSLQAGASDPFLRLKSPNLSQNAGDPNDPKLQGAGYIFPEAAIGKNTYGLPGWTRQADVLRPIAPILSARDDSFVIRAYGDARTENGTIKARAWCEATVRRTREYVDPADAAEITTLPQRPINLSHGRRYQILSFRWLAPEEV